MPPPPTIAATFDPDRLSFRDHETLGGIVRYAHEAGWRLDLDPFAARRAPAGRCDGLLVRLRPRHAIGRFDIPAVCVGLRPRGVALPQATENHYAAGRIAAWHFIQRGYSGFACLGPHQGVGTRGAGVSFGGELRWLGRHPDAHRVLAASRGGPAQWDAALASLDAWLAGLEPPVGILVARPGLARTLANLALARGLRVPQDVGIIAADDDPVLCEMPPALTAIRFDYAEVGYRAAHLLDRLLHGQPPPKQAVLVTPTVVPRQSTDRESVADPLVADALWFIDSHRNEPIRPRDVAAAVGLAERTLRLRFRRAGRDTVHREIAKARIEHAKLLIENRTTLPLELRPGGPPVRITLDTSAPDTTANPELEARLDAELARHGDPEARRRLQRHRRVRAAQVASAAHDSGFGSYDALLRAFKRHAGAAPLAWKRRKT
ncbi:MAG TPA: substrate-binding domain-containing protein [Planctomycetota bacterium]|nr:substrate-binding domain-containing protein [Planctomycetota bacterium]